MKVFCKIKIMTGTRDCALRGGYKICLIVCEKQSWYVDCTKVCEMFLFLLVYKLLWLLTASSSGLLTSTVSESLGSYEKLPQAEVGGITLGGKMRVPSLWLVGWLVHPPTYTSPLSLSSVGQTQIRFLVPKFGLEIWPLFTSKFLQLKRVVGRVIIVAALHQVSDGTGDYYVTFTKNSKSTKNECFVCRYSFHCDNITKANHPPSRSIFLKIIDFFLQNDRLLVLTFTTSQ